MKHLLNDNISFFKHVKCHKNYFCLKQLFHLNSINLKVIIKVLPRRRRCPMWLKYTITLRYWSVNKDQYCTQIVLTCIFTLNPVKKPWHSSFITNTAQSWANNCICLLQRNRPFCFRKIKYSRLNYRISCKLAVSPYFTSV